MDRKTEEVLRKIGRSIPKDLLDKAYKTEKDVSRENIAREVLDNRHISQEGRDRVKQHLEKGHFNSPERLRNNSEAEKEIDAYMEEKVRQAIRRGEIEDPKKDRYIQEMRRRMDR